MNLVDLKNKLSKLGLSQNRQLKQNLIAYGFLAIPLLLLAMFTFYPILQGVYISFMDYPVLKNPTLGGPIAFMTAFIRNLSQGTNVLWSIGLFLLSLILLIAMVIKRVSRKIIFLLVIVLFIVNLIPLRQVLTKTFQDINYVLEEDRTIANDMVPAYVEMLKGQFGKQALIVKKAVNKDETRVYVKRSIWVGWGNYQKILPNQEYTDFVKRNPWYVLLLLSPVLGFILIYVLTGPRRRNRTLDVSLKTITLSLVFILLIISWPRVFNGTTWQFYDALQNSLKYLLVVIPLQIASVLLAILVNQKIKGVTFFRMLYYIPVITGVVLIGYCWKFIFQPNGLLDAIMKMTHLVKEPIAWLGDPHIALFSIMFVTFWRGLGYYMVLYLAGLQDISQELLEAARIDGASTSQLITKIYVPLLRPIILVCTVLSTMAALRVFEEIFVLSGGSAATTPMNGTITMVYLIYDRAFGLIGGLQFSYSAGLAVILSIFIALVTALNFRLERGLQR
ncbi:MAG TPA: sugar ABC transporter permease [Bacillota bacterium]|nr:sugar ABC transporter permease [Bacillota bacterium]